MIHSFLSRSLFALACLLDVSDSASFIVSCFIFSLSSLRSIVHLSRFNDGNDTGSLSGVEQRIDSDTT